MSGLKTDINENISPINFKDSVKLEKLKIESSHATNKKAVFINTDTGELYSAEVTTSGSGGNTTGAFESASPHNQSMSAVITNFDGDIACISPITLEPEGRVDVLINGLSVDLGITKAAYFSGDGGSSARVRGNAEVGDLLYWNGSIAGYELDVNDKIDFDYLTSSIYENAPLLAVTISNGPWEIYPDGSYVLSSSLYEEPPLESWSYTIDVDNYIKLFTSESATDLINACQIAVNGVVETYTLLNPIGPITQDQKKIVDGLFKAYLVNGVTLVLSRGANWDDFTL